MDNMDKDAAFQNFHDKTQNKRVRIRKLNGWERTSGKNQITKMVYDEGVVWATNHVGDNQLGDTFRSTWAT